MVPGNGRLFSAALVALMGVWFLYVWPRNVRRQIERGDLSEEDGQARLRMCPPSSGYVLFLLAILFTCEWLFDNGFFSGREIIVGVLMLGFSLGLIAFAVWRMRKANLPKIPHKKASPHKYPLFWMMVALAGTGASLPLLLPASGSFLPRVFQSLFTFAVGVTIAWFVCRRIIPYFPVSRTGVVRGFLVVLGFILLFVFFAFVGYARQHRLSQKKFSPIDEKPDYIKKLEQWKP